MDAYMHHSKDNLLQHTLIGIVMKIFFTAYIWPNLHMILIDIGIL